MMKTVFECGDYYSMPSCDKSLNDPLKIETVVTAQEWFYEQNVHDLRAINIAVLFIVPVLLEFPGMINSMSA